MAVRADIRYVQYHVDGNTARRVERETEVNTAAPVYTPSPAKTRVIAVDPVAVCGIVLAVVMLIAMVAGLLQYRACLEQSQRMSQYVQQLQAQNQQLDKEYHDGYDVDEIMDIAMEAGMVPAESVETVRISMDNQQDRELETSFWQTLTRFLAGIFA